MKQEEPKRNLEFKVYPNDKSPKLFKNKYLEVLTKTKLWIIVTLYSTIATALIFTNLYYLDGSVTGTIGLFLAGAFSWTLAEYVMHRFVYHKIKDSSYDDGLQYVFHGVHHQYPSDDDRIILPPVPSIVIAGAFFGLFYLLMGNYAFSFAPGFMMGYSAYISIHWMVHKKQPPKHLNFWWKHHTIHHYQQHDRAFGVSTSFWDHVFRTMPEPQRKTITILTTK